MADLKAIREKAAESKKRLQDLRVQRIREDVKNVIESDSFTISMLDKMGNADSNSAQDKFTEKVAKQIAETMADPTENFIAVCKSRGLNDRKISKAVDMINDLFRLTESDDPAVRLRAVAEYMSVNEKLYDDIAYLS